jgi:hypothetical protein
MNERAAAWVDGLFPRVPVRQWVLTVPWAAGPDADDGQAVLRGGPRSRAAGRRERAVRAQGPQALAWLAGRRRPARVSS